MDYEKTANIISTIGFPIAIVLGMGLATWRAMVWAAPYFARVVESHLTFLTSVQSSIDALKDTGETTIHAITELTRQLSDRDDRLAKVLEEIARRPCQLPQAYQHLKHTSPAMPQEKP